MVIKWKEKPEEFKEELKEQPEENRKEEEKTDVEDIKIKRHLDYQKIMYIKNVKGVLIIELGK